MSERLRPPRDDPAAELVRLLADRAESFTERVAPEIRRHHPRYLRIGPDGFDPLAFACRRNVTLALEWMGRDDAPTGADLAYHRRAFARNARAGEAVTDVLGSLRLGFQEIWNELAAASEDGDVLRLLTGRLWVAYERLAALAAEAYAEGRRDLDLLRNRDLTELWRLLRRLPDGEAAARHAATRLGLDADAVHLAWAGSERLAIDERSVPGVEHVHLDDAVVGFAPDPGPAHRAAVVRAAAGCGRPVGVGPPRRGLAGLHQSSLDARRALVVAERRGRVVEFAADVVAAMALDDSLGLDVAVERVEADVASDAALAAALAAYLGDGRRLRSTARRLGVHPNTLAYRIERFEQRTGLDLAHPHDHLVAVVALTRAGHDLSARRDASP